jgi:TetR/AcrR family transcriptional repressor of lmrAB and yxaGH operons
MASARDRIIETTSQLLETQGYHATGLSQIIVESGSPRGSLYYYFPQGKEELSAEAVARAGKQTAQRIAEGLARVEDPGEALHRFIQDIAYYIEQSHFSAGGPLTIVAMETVNSSDRLNHVCREAYQLLQQAFADKFVSSGYPETRAAQLSLFITATIEGGIILSRTHHSSEPLKRIADELYNYIKSIAAEV